MAPGPSTAMSSVTEISQRGPGAMPVVGRAIATGWPLLATFDSALSAWDTLGLAEEREYGDVHVKHPVLVLSLEFPIVAALSLAAAFEA